MLSALLQKLLFINQFNIKEGKVEILGSRYIMLNASDLWRLQETDETKTYAVLKDVSKGNLKEMIEHAKVYKGLKDESLKNIADLSKRIGKSDEGVISTLQNLFELYGLGKMNITNLDNKNKQASILLSDSTIAKEQIKQSGKSKVPVCTVTKGILAGIFSYLFKHDVDCFEKKCMAKGDDMCAFVIQ
jgi:predicted hydrocarbon binding protein